MYYCSCFTDTNIQTKKYKTKHFFVLIVQLGQKAGNVPFAAIFSQSKKYTEKQAITKYYFYKTSGISVRFFIFAF